MSFPIQQSIIYGAHPGTIADHEITGGITLDLFVGFPPEVTAVGESDVLAGQAVGGGNTVLLVNSIAAPANPASAVGDAFTVTDHAQAGHNTVTVSTNGTADAAGDAVTLSGHAQGGHNTVTADTLGAANAYGDAFTMTDHAAGGNNTVSGFSGQGVPSLFGDAETLSGFASGGHNTVTAEGTSVMYGDAYELADHASGGGNLLTGPSNPHGIFGPPVPNVMYGDGYELLDHASGGGNTLVSGQNSNDVMWGDAAIVSPNAHTRANTFVFAPQNGHDTIMDFRSGEDHIDLQGFGFTSFQQLEQDFHQTASGLDIVFDTSNDILLSGVSKVVAGDFVFT